MNIPQNFALALLFLLFQYAWGKAGREFAVQILDAFKMRMVVPYGVGQSPSFL